MSNCNCPLPTELQDIGAQGCPFNVGQIQRVIITRANNSVFPVTIASSDPAVIGTWTPLLSANDDTKVVKTPLVGGNPAIVGGSAITQGGNDNSTLNGEVEVTGTESSVFTADFKDLEPAIARAIKLLKCESVVFSLGGLACVSCWYPNEFQSVSCDTCDTSPTRERGTDFQIDPIPFLARASGW